MISRTEDHDRYEPRDYENDRTFITRRAWFKIKNALGATAFRFRDLMVGFETVAPGLSNPRILLAVAAWEFLNKSRSEQEECIRRYHKWCDKDQPVIVETPSPSADKQRHDAELLQMMKAIIGKNDGYDGMRGVT